MYVFIFNWLFTFNFSLLIRWNLSVRCASSCGDTFTQTIASTSSLTFLFLHFYFYWLLFFEFIFSIDSFIFIHFKRSLFYFMCLLFMISFYDFWFYIFTVSFMFITFYFTHFNLMTLRYNLDFISWHCCPLLFRVDKICSYSYFIRNFKITTSTDSFIYLLALCVSCQIIFQNRML